MPVAAETGRNRATSRGTEEWHLCGVLSQGERTRETPIAEPRFRVGRRSNCDLCLTWPTVSGLHAEFVTLPDALFLRDMGSTNGTFVNGHRVDSDTPVHEGDVLHLGGVEFCVRRRSPSDEFGTAQWDAQKLSTRLLGFDRLVEGNELVPHYQPIVQLHGRQTVAYEVLARSRNPEFPTPFEMFETAEQLDREQDLSEACRQSGVLLGRHLPGGQRLFLNTQPVELQGDRLMPSLERLREAIPDQPLSLEIHEAAVTDPEIMADVQYRLIELDIQLVYDDFGAGQARLLDLVDVPPDVLKFDISLVRNIHRASPKRRQMVATLVQMVRDFGIVALAEGIESQDEADVCRDLGFEYAQGFYFGRPAPAGAWRQESTWIQSDQDES